MRLFHNDPWAMIDQIRHEMNRISDTRSNGEEGSYIATSDWAPAVDIHEGDDSYVLRADIPGVEPGDIEINMENGILSIRGQRPAEAQAANGYKRIERPRGAFYRRFSMPDSVDAERISARCQLGVLEVTIPKHAKQQSRRITIEQ